MNAASTVEYATLNKAQKAMRENFAAGDLSGFESHEEWLRAIRAIDRRLSKIAYEHASHTPSPWCWNGYSLEPVNKDPGISNVHTILEMENGGTGFIDSDPRQTLAELDANRALIAAAPDLLEAAKKAEAIFTRQGWRDGDTFNPEAIAANALRAAIIKAQTITPNETLQQETT